MNTDSSVAARSYVDDPGYRPFLEGVAETFSAMIAGAGALFTVDTDGLWEQYLSAFPAEQRQTYTCSACRHFITRFGGLVSIDTYGRRVPLLWDPNAIPAEFAPIAVALHDAVARRPVVGAFVSTGGVLGTPETGPWHHLFAHLPAGRLTHSDRLRTPSELTAAIRENVGTVERALAEFPQSALAEALRILEADALSRAEKFIGPVRWLLHLQDARAVTLDERMRSALVWRAVATAPEGYCHPRASVIGPLLEGIIAGKPYEVLRSEFAAMLAPLRYQRPQAAPSAGNIAEAERVFAALGLAPALERRFARLSECATRWFPRSTPRPAETGGVFGHLTPKTAEAPVGVHLPTQTMTWDKFSRTVLPQAERLELLVPDHGAFIALTAASLEEAPPIIRWDRPEHRNTVGWYVYHHGSDATQWRLRGGAWCDVTAVVPFPNLWGEPPSPQFADGDILVLSGAVDTKPQSLALFPELLRDDLRAVRATVEAYSQRGRLTGTEEASACGYDLRKGGSVACRLRVTTTGRATEYRIDRWD